MSAAITPQEIRQSYRLLLRSSLLAVRYAAPARYVLLQRIRRAFRSSPVTDYDPRRIANTVTFLNNAAKDRGMEHKVVKGLVQVWEHEKRQWAERQTPYLIRHRRKKGGIGGEEHGGGVVCQAYDQWYWTIGMLNESLGLCIR
jgi:hypothetical protein